MMDMMDMMDMIKTMDMIDMIDVDHYPILNNDFLSFNSFNITWKAKCIFYYQGSYISQLRGRDFTDPYTP